MNKPASLRAHLLSAVKALEHNPDRLLIYVDEGKVHSTLATGLSFQYSYTLQLILTDFAASPDAVVIPLLAWLKTNQPELLTNHGQISDAIEFEVDIIDHSKVDLQISLPLTERVIVKQQNDGTLAISYPPEPQYTEQLPAQTYQLLADGNVLASWTSAAPDGGVALPSPHPGPRP